MKKLLSLLLTLSLLLALGVTASAAEFPDVPAGSPYAQAVQWVSQQGYIQGYNDGTFGVNNNVTRAQFSAILYRAAGGPAASGTTRFPDVASTAYYVSAASWVADGGVSGELRPRGLWCSRGFAPARRDDHAVYRP